MSDYSLFVVKVNGGSGCIFQIHGTPYTYILTAKHVVEKENVFVLRQFLDDNQQSVEKSLTVIGSPYLHSDANKDAAILKVEKVSGVESLARIEDPTLIRQKVQIAGYPNSRALQPYAYRSDDLAVKNFKQHRFIEGQLDRPAAYNEIVGYSGGGIFFSSNDQNYLVGIQAKMSAEDEVEMLGNIDFMPLSFFDEIILENAELAPLMPEHLHCFSTLKSYAIKLEGCIIDNNVAFTREYLREMTANIVASNLTPNMLKEFFNKRLLLFDHGLNVLNDRGLWIAWLEFLIILNIIREEKVTDKNISEVFNEFRLIYSNTAGDWTGELSNIIKSDFKGMSPNAKVVVATQTRPAKSIIEKGMVNNIIRANHVPKSQMQIDDGIDHPLENFKLVHLYAFQQHGIIDKELEYCDFTALNEPELFIKLKAEFNALFA